MEYLHSIFSSNLNATVNNGGFISFLPENPWEHDNHAFNQNKFYFITKGRCTITIGSRTCEGRAGDWFFIPSGTVHRFEKDNTAIFEKYWMHFDIYPQEANFFDMLGLDYVVRYEKNDIAIGLFESYAATESTTIADILKVKAIVLELIARYVELSGKSCVSVKNSTDERLDSLIGYITQNLASPISNLELSSLCGLHPNHFIRFFKERTGQTPTRYIKWRRMEKAKRLLEETDLNISEIMTRVGFDDISYFSKQFRLFYSMSPREFRKYYAFHKQSAEKQLNK